MFRNSGSLARFREVVIATPNRRKGGCTHLLAAMIQDARARGIADRFLLVADTDSAARRLYEALGFRVIGHQYALVADV